jgi:hypothetical protein
MTILVNLFTRSVTRKVGDIKYHITLNTIFDVLDMINKKDIIKDQSSYEFKKKSYLTNNVCHVSLCDWVEALKKVTWH